MSSSDQNNIGSSSLSRRSFLHTTGAAAAIGAASAQANAVGKVLLATGVLGANERIGVGLIGCGGRGGSLIQSVATLKKQGVAVDIVAACDIYRPRLDKIAKMYNATPYMDHKELLADKRVDVVVIATPDHHHAQQVIDAAQAGKDAYVEKPLSHWSQFELTRKMYHEVKRLNRVVQVGAQYMSDSAWHQGAALVREGAIGQPIMADCGYYRVGDWGERGMPIDDPNAKPGKDLNWDAFLGDRPKRDFDVSRLFRWRMYEDYSGGPVTDLYPHVLTPIVNVMGVKLPQAVVAIGGKYRYQEREVPDSFNMIIDYPGNCCIAVLGTQGNDYPPEEKRRCGVPVPAIRGWEATLTIEGNDLVILPNRGSAKPAKRIKIERSLNQEVFTNNFLECCRTRQQPWSPIEMGYHVQTALQMGMLAYRNGKTARFNAEKEEIVL